jgi:hypothetical protein
VNSSVYASLNTSGQVVLVALNKASSSKTVSLSVSHGATLRTAQVYTLTGASATPTRQPDVALLPGNILSFTMPAMSVSTMVLVP